MLDTHALLWMDRNDPTLEIAIDGRVSLLATRLEELHRDPADRFIVATSLQLGATLVTADRQILGWDGALPRQDATA